MIQVNTLYGLENVSNCYWVINDGSIINKNTGNVKSQTLGKRGYYYVSLNEKKTNRQVKVPVHKIITLAFIKNEPYQDINHKDGNKQNNAIENLEFCTRQRNVIHAWEQGLITREERLFKVNFENYSVIGTMKELRDELKIPRATLYDIFYNKRMSKKYGINNIVEVFDNERQETIETVTPA